VSNERFDHPSYTIRRKVFTVAGAKFHIYDPAGQLVFYTKQKAFKLKEDIRLFSDENMAEELLVLQARTVIDFGVTYDVFDSVTQETVGSLRRKGMKSMLRDEWLVFDPDGREVGVIKEDSTGLAVLRRMHEVFSLILPQAHHLEMDGQTVGTYRQNRNPFVHKTMVELANGDSGLDRRLGIATGVLLSAIEGRQS
jgi:hypothetical protein